MKTLVVMRHAKAESSGPSDFERRLAESGLADAAEAGEWLAARGVEPDLALVSEAARTVQTWEAMAEAAGWDLEVATYDVALYDAGPESALDLIRAVPPGTSCLVVVGHNPTTAYLAQLLDDGEGDDEAGTQMALGYPPAAATVFTFDGEWADLDEASATVTAFHVGRG